MRYKKDRVRKNLTLDRETADMLDVVCRMTGASQSDVVDKAFSTGPAVLMYAFCKDRHHAVANWLEAFAAYEGYYTPEFAKSVAGVVHFIVTDVGHYLVTKESVSFDDCCSKAAEMFDSCFGTEFLKGDGKAAFCKRYEELRSHSEGIYSGPVTVLSIYDLLWREYHEELPAYGADMCRFVSEFIHGFHYCPEDRFRIIWNLFDENWLFFQYLGH